MTLDQAKAFLERWRFFASWGLCVILGFMLVRGCNRTGRAEADLARVQEQLELERNGQEVVDPVPDVRPRVDQLEAENEDLRVALAKARAAAPGATPIGAGHASTGPVHVGGVPPVLVSPPQPEASAPCPVCLLVAGDTGEVRVDQVVLETKGGNKVLVGAAAAWRLMPAPETKLFGGPFDADLTGFAEKVPPDAPGSRWGAGPLVGVSGQGWLAGGVLTSPEARLPLIGWRVSAAVVAAAGSSQGLALAGVVVRP